VPGIAVVGTSIVKKLGITSGARVLVIGSPAPYSELVPGIPDDVELVSARAKSVDVIHYFTKSRSGLRAALLKFKSQIKQDGMVWVSWPKKASGVQTDLTENVIRDDALTAGLVDVKVCAVDETWSGLKLVIRTANRRP
jgi:hypothetical protein